MTLTGRKTTKSGRGRGRGVLALTSYEPCPRPGPGTIGALDVDEKTPKPMPLGEINKNTLNISNGLNSASPSQQSQHHAQWQDKNEQQPFQQAQRQEQGQQHRSQQQQQRQHQQQQQQQEQQPQQQHQQQQQQRNNQQRHQQNQQQQQRQMQNHHQQQQRHPQQRQHQNQHQQQRQHQNQHRQFNRQHQQNLQQSRQNFVGNVMAKYNYQAQPGQPGGFPELSLKQGEKVMLICKGHKKTQNPHWWQVRNENGEQGFVPGKYCVDIEVEEPEDIGIELLAKYNYQAQPGQPGGFPELSLKQGEKVMLICKGHSESKNPHWWQVRNEKGEIGYVPGKYCLEL